LFFLLRLEIFLILVGKFRETPPPPPPPAPDTALLIRT